MKVYFSNLPWSVDDYRDKFITHEWLHLILLLNPNLCLCALCPLYLNMVFIGVVVLSVQPGLEMQNCEFIIFKLLLHQTARMTVYWHFTSFTALIPEIHKDWFMLFKSFLRPHGEGSETDEGPVNITKYKNIYIKLSNTTLAGSLLLIKSSR